MLTKKFIPSPKDNKMKHEGDVLRARKIFFKKKNNNLRFLLKTRYDWIDKQIDKYISETRIKRPKIIELGCGAGFIKFFLKKEIILTDVKKYSWVDFSTQAEDLKEIKTNSTDVLILSHTFHHIKNISLFFINAIRVLNKGGLIIIHDPELSLTFKFVVYFMKHEGYDLTADPYYDFKDYKKSNPWECNLAFAKLVFSDQEKFEKKFPSLKIIENSLREFTIFALSGGVVAKTYFINLPKFILYLFHYIDCFLISIFPSIFPWVRRIVIKKK